MPRLALLMPQGDGNPRGGDTGPSRQAGIDDQLYLSGKMSQAQPQERRQARADGALAGSKVAGVGPSLVRGGVGLARTGISGLRVGLASTKAFSGQAGR